MATSIKTARKATQRRALSVRQQIALRIAAGIYAGPAGYAILEKGDGVLARQVTKRTLEFADIFLEVSA